MSRTETSQTDRYQIAVYGRGFAVVDTVDRPYDPSGFNRFVSDKRGGRVRQFKTVDGAERLAAELNAAKPTQPQTA